MTQDSENAYAKPSVVNGRTEAVSPELFFNAGQYCCYKALMFYQEKANGGFSEEEIRADLPHFAASIAETIHKAGISIWQHYTRYGTAEGINPSDDFSTVAYLQAKAKALNVAGVLNKGLPWNWESVGLALRNANMNALEHFVRYAGKGPSEVPFGLTSQGKIPERYAVPEAERVGKVPSFGGATYTVERKEGSQAEPAAKQPQKHDPKEFFSVGEYLQFKALEFFQRQDQGGLTVEQIRRNMPLYAAEILHALNKAGLDPWKHYQLYGTVEGINPSNAFDTITYLQAKAAALNSAGLLLNGQPWDAESVAKAFKYAHLSALEHFLLYAGTGPGEVVQTLTEDGEIPEDFRVSDAMQVSTAVLADLRFEAAATQQRVPAPVEQKGIQIAGKRAVPLPQDQTGTEMTLKGDDGRLPEYYTPFLSRKSGLQSIAIGVRNQLWRKSLARRLILLTVILPSIFVFLYLLFWASNAYISEAKFAVRGQNSSPGLEGFSSLFSLPSSSQNDSYIVMNYIQSYDMFRALDKDLHLRDHYADKKNDIWYRLEANPTQEDILDFWKWACEVSYDPDTSILEVRVKAFTPEKALAVCEGILSRSEELVNAMNIRSRQDAIRQAEQEVARAEERIRKARESMHQYREKTVILDPEAVATGLYSVVNKLESEVTKTTAELSEAKSYMKSGSPRVKQLENRLQVLRQQLTAEKKRLAGKLKDNQSLNDLLSGFQALTLEEEFAQKQLTSAMTSLEAARVRADAQSEYVEAFQRPVLADESLYPRPLLFSFIYMITSLLLLGLLSLIVAAVREHAGF